LMRYMVCRVTPVSFAICTMPSAWFPSIIRTALSWSRVLLGFKPR
jgi:hypothetical protein